MGLQTEVESMFSEKQSLLEEYNQLMTVREMALNKYTKLYNFVKEASSSRQSYFNTASNPPNFPDKDSSKKWKHLMANERQVFNNLTTTS